MPQIEKEIEIDAFPEEVWTVLGERLLRRSLTANAVFSGASGAVLVLASRPVAAFLGWMDPVAPAVLDSRRRSARRAGTRSERGFGRERTLDMACDALRELCMWLAIVRRQRKRTTRRDLAAAATRSSIRMRRSRTMRSEPTFYVGASAHFELRGHSRFLRSGDRAVPPDPRAHRIERSRR